VCVPSPAIVLRYVWTIEKTPGQIVNEFDEMLDIEQERAKKRQGTRTDIEQHSGNVSKKSEDQPAREKAAEKTNEDCCTHRPIGQCRTCVLCVSAPTVRTVQKYRGVFPARSTAVTESEGHGVSSSPVLTYRV